jgi:hypothetical protein
MCDSRQMFARLKTCEEEEEVDRVQMADSL